MNEKNLNQEEMKEASQECNFNAPAETEKTQLSADGYIADLTSRVTTFCSLPANTPEEKARVFKVMNAPEKKIADCINLQINATDLFCEVVQCVSETTGEIENLPRIVIIDDKGVSYQCVSKGIFGSIKKLIAVYGQPTWNTPIPLIVKQVPTKKGSALTFDINAD